MSVHIQIAEQVKNHRQAQQRFLELDARREQAIEAAIKQVQQTKDISVQQINSVTEEMNQIAKKFQFPVRQIVSKEMVLSHARK